MGERRRRCGGEVDEKEDIQEVREKEMWGEEEEKEDIQEVRGEGELR